MRFSTLITALFSTSLAFVATRVHAKDAVPDAKTSSPAATTPSAQGVMNVLAFGDSLTAGFRLATSQAFPAQLESVLNKEGYPVKVTNAGVSGDTSAQALRRVEWSLKHGKYELALLCIGANDGLRQLPVADFDKNLRKIVEKFRAAGIKVVLIGIRLPSNFSESYRKSFEGVYPKIAADMKLEFVPFLLEGVAMEDLLNLEDRIHPNENGHKIIARKLADFLKPKLRKAVL